MPHQIAPPAHRQYSQQHQPQPLQQAQKADYQELVQARHRSGAQPHEQKQATALDQGQVQQVAQPQQDYAAINAAYHKQLPCPMIYELPNPMTAFIQQHAQPYNPANSLSMTGSIGFWKSFFTRKARNEPLPDPALYRGGQPGVASPREAVPWTAERERVCKFLTEHPADFCPSRFAWYPAFHGYRCYGGTHLCSHAMAAEIMASEPRPPGFWFLPNLRDSDREMQKRWTEAQRRDPRRTRVRRHYAGN